MTYNAKAARRLPGKTNNFCYNKLHFISTKFFTLSIWQMWHRPSDRQGAERAAYVVWRTKPGPLS